MSGIGLSWRRTFQQLMLLAMRACMTAAKFLLAVYTARYLGLADLGVYGLLVGATTIVPAVVGLGLTDWIVRRIVDVPSREAMPLVASRLSLTCSIHAVALPLALACDLLLGEPVPFRLALLSGLILMLENLGTEATDLLIARRRVFLAYWLAFLRIGFWPLPVMALGMLHPSLRTLDALLLGWLVTLVVVWLILCTMLLFGQRWRFMRPSWRLLRQGLRGSLVLYVKDVSGTVSTFVDRFLISFYLGLELTGVYTLFWSITNVVHSLSVSGVLQSQLASLVAAGHQADPAAFRALERRLQIETGGWALALALGAAVVTPVLLPYLDRPMLQDHLPVFWVILVATLLRIAADGYGFVLYALHLDRTIAVVALSGALASATMNALIVPYAGLWGTAATYLLTAAALFAARFELSRPKSLPSDARGIRCKS